MTRDVVVGIRPEHVVLARGETDEHTIEAETLIRGLDLGPTRWTRLAGLSVASSASRSGCRRRCPAGSAAGARLTVMLDHASLFDAPIYIRLEDADRVNASKLNPD
jgi:hypothetical protein